MSATQTPQLDATRAGCFVRPRGLDAQSLGYTQSDTRMILFFQAGRCSLADEEIATLRRWIDIRNQPGSEKHLIVGGAYETPRPNRLRRLHYLMVVIEELGVPRCRFHQDEDWTRFTGVSLAEAAPADVVWLQSRNYPTLPLAMSQTASRSGLDRSSSI